MTDKKLYMKILVLAPTPFFSHRGTHIRIYEQASGLVKFNHQISILTYHLGIDPVWDNKSIRVLRIPALFSWYKKTEAGPSWQKIFLDLFLFVKGFFYIIKNHPKIIHAHLHEGVFIGWLLQKTFFYFKIKLVADFHGSLVREMIDHDYLKNKMVRSCFSKLERFIFNLGDRAIVSSPENVESINKLRQKNEAILVADGIDLESYARPIDRDIVRTKYKLPQDKKIIIYTGAFLANKGFAELIDLYESLVKDQLSLHFVIAGDPIEKFEEIKISEGLKNNLTVVSPLSYFDLPELLKVSDIAVEPKAIESLQGSGKIISYMAAGLPIVCHSRSTNEFYSVGQSFSLFEQIKKLLSDPSLCVTQGKINLEKAKRFSRAERAQEINQIYNSCYEAN